ncbi:MAG: UPF0280 family protein [Methanobrevibacter thaueri]|uniref:UPF0280 family protein n=1 Tax=Methanobrevibacter thaueri TaxID=190975 RepID=A0A8T3VD29_9EURY|nr:UPF0280 family protein [Methanobrevibacter thaueri]MBE6501245.1 UPF0280 family protein [Methanobrevibacter thaueri]
MEINIGETHIRLRSDVTDHDLENYIRSIRADLSSYIAQNPDFLHSFNPIPSNDENLPLIVSKMYESSSLCEVGPMACVAGTISEMSLDYLMDMNSKNSIVENGGDIALVNDRTVLCGIYSENEILGNGIAFKITERKSPLGICTSSGKIGHSISFGASDSVTVISNSASVADGLATRIANDAKGQNSEDRVSNAAETAESYSDLFDGVLIICGGNVATVGRLPKIVETDKFDINKI